MPLLRFLVSIEAISKEDAAAARAAAAAQGKHIIEVLADKIDEANVADLLSTHLGIPRVDPSADGIDREAMSRVSKELATRYDAMPVRMESGKLLVAFANPVDTEAIKALEFSGRTKVKVAVAPLSRLRASIKHHYYFNEELNTMLSAGVGGKVEVEAKRDDDEESHDLLAEGEDRTSVIRVVQLLLVEGIQLGASDIHIEPTANALAVRYRLNGVLEAGVTVPKTLQNQVVARVKVMASLDITERRKPQDGSIRVRYDNRSVDVRVSVLPTPLGEKVVLRLLDAEAKDHSLEKAGLMPEGITVVRRESRRPEGLILMSGPTGSGKTSTAHAILRDIASSRLNIITIENPVEYRLAGITQVEVNEKQGLTFAGTLRSVLRQDPDVIFVGEIRDPETAKIALQASQTGHLVLSTVHTIDAVSSITRLLDLGVDPVQISGALRLVIAQRLVREVCTHCRQPQEPSEFELQRMGAAAGDIAHAFVGMGCERCRRTGYTGRLGIFELLAVSPELRAMIERQEPETVIRARARQEGIASMYMRALEAVNAGRTSIEEVLRVVPPEARESLAAPSVEAVAGGQPAAPAAPAVPEVFRILVVDDQPDILKMMRFTLQKLPLPVEVLTASDGPTALSMLESVTVHLALLDVMMPGMTGVELCEQLRSQPQHALIPVFMLTALDELDIKESAFRTGADDYLTKPFKREELLARVVRALCRTYGAKVKTSERSGATAAAGAMPGALADDVGADEHASAGAALEPPPLAIPPSAPPLIAAETLAAQPHAIPIPVTSIEIAAHAPPVVAQSSPFAIVHNALVPEPAAAASPEPAPGFALDAAHDAEAVPAAELDLETAPDVAFDAELTLEIEATPDPELALDRELRLAVEAASGSEPETDEIAVEHAPARFDAEPPPGAASHPAPAAPPIAPPSDQFAAGQFSAAFAEPEASPAVTAEPEPAPTTEREPVTEPEPVAAAAPAAAEPPPLAAATAPGATAEAPRAAPPPPPKPAPAPQAAGPGAAADAAQTGAPEAASRASIAPRPASVAKGALPSAPPNRQDIWKKFVSQRRS